jgi:autotransporter-associated beta strand protein
VLARILAAAVVMAAPFQVYANIPGGGTGAGPNVTLVDNGGSVTIGNGIISILCTKSGATINQINYIYSNGSGTITNQLLSGGNNGGQLYWENSTTQSLTFTYSLVANPANNGGNYAEIALVTTSVPNDVLEVHYSMLRGSSGFYVTPIWSHRSIDDALSMGECRDNIYAGAIFNWMSVDATRNRLMEVSSGLAIGVLGAPVEVSLWTNGVYQGQYEDKYKYSANFGVERVWGWSSVGSGGANVGLWDVTASPEYYNGGPMKPELMSHIGTTILNMAHGSHYNMGNDGNFASGEVWTKVYGPHFIYCNNIAKTITDVTQASSALYSDAVAQAAAEQTAWPYSWFTNANYAGASTRGAVSGIIIINDTYNPNASPAGLWVGVVNQPYTTSATYDFQKWMKPYQFWVKTDSNGNFTIPNVIAGTNYTLYAFGPGAAGTFMSQNQTGGNPPILYDLAATNFGVTVTAGATNNLGSVTWTPTRVGPTVFEIGYPDRKGDKFRHGDDYWVGDIGPSPTAPSPIWSKFLEYPFDFPSGPNYVVGKSRWSTDWNFVQPIVTDNQGNYNPSTSTITFNLASAPSNISTASLYLAVASDYSGPLIVSVNGNNLGSTAGVTSVPNANSPNGYSPFYGASDTTVREGPNGAFSDERLTFPANLLQAGANTITINMRKGGYFANHAMYDYIRFELTGYVPPAPASVAAYPGNNSSLIAWPVTPGATGYSVLSTTTSGSNYTLIASNVIGPVCGSGSNYATWLDANAVNGATYYYVVQSVNLIGTSANSPESPGATPSPSVSTSPPAMPTGISASVGHGTATLTWSGSPGANYYTIQRSVMVNNGVGVYIPLNLITLDNGTTNTTYTDVALTDGSTYNYFVSASSAGGTSSNSAPVQVKPLPSPPAAAPTPLTYSIVSTTNVTLSWPAISSAVGYIVKRAVNNINGPYTFLMSVTESTCTDVGLSFNNTYYYEVAAMNAAGTSTNSVVTVTLAPAAPATLTATPGNTTILLSWSASSGATSYTLKRGLGSGNENTTVVSGYAGTSYTDSNLVNGTTYYYMVTATGPGGTSGNSPEASATPSVIAGLLWTGAVSTSWDTTATNWLNGGLTAAVYTDGSSVNFDDSAVTTTVVIDGTVSPGNVTFANSNATYNVSTTGSGIAGLAGIVKGNAGTLALTTSNAYSGGTLVLGGTLTVANATAAGSGSITLNGGVLNNNASIANAMNITGPSYLNTGNSQITGNWTGNGLLNILISGGNNTFTVTGVMTNFSGTFAFGDSTGYFRHYGSLGSALATFDLGSSNLTMNNRNGGTTIQFGALVGGSNTALSGRSTGGSGSTTIYVVGGNSAGATFNGGIADGNSPMAITKVGAGTWTLTNPNNTFSAGLIISNGTLQIGNGNASATLGTGNVLNNATLTFNHSDMAANALVISGTGQLIHLGSGALSMTVGSTYSGGTIVSNGTLLVNNTVGSGTGTGAVTVVSGATLGGTGVIAGPVAVNGTLAPGSSVGTLTISNNLVLNSGTVLAYDLGTSSDLARVSGTLTLGGTLNISNAGGFGAGTYVLFTYGGSLTYSGVSIGSAPAGYNYSIDTGTVGQVKLVVSAWTAFQQWQMNYFGCTNCPQAAPDADPLGKGMSNTNQFLAGLNPTNSASALRIISAVPQSNDVVITWTTAGLRTNAVQATAGDANGGYATNFTNISGSIIIPGSGDTTTNYVDTGGASNTPSRYYRIRLVP